MTENETSVKQEKYKQGRNPNSLKNLHPRWKPGESGNPHGFSLTSSLELAIEKPHIPPADDAPVRDKIVYSTIEGALLREPTPFREVWDRLEGKVAEPAEGRLADNLVINIIVSSEEAKSLTENVGRRLLGIK